MSNISVFSIIDPDIIVAPWETEMFSIVAYTSVLDRGERAYLGYTLGNGVEGYFPEAIFYWSSGGPIFWGEYQGTILTIDRFAGLYEDQECLNYQTLFSAEQQHLYGTLAGSIYGHWMVPNRHGIFGAFNLNRLPEMSLEALKGVEYYIHGNNAEWSVLAEHLIEAEIPYGLGCMPRIHARMSEVLNETVDGGSTEVVPQSSTIH